MINTKTQKSYLNLTRNIIIHNLSDMKYNGNDIGKIFRIDKSVVCRILDMDLKELIQDYNQGFYKLKSVDYNK